MASPEKKKSLRQRLKAKKAELKSKSGGGFYFTIKEGTTRMRPLPVGEENDFAIEVVHFYLTKELGGGVISPATFGEKCPFMKKYNELSKSSSAEDREFAKRMKPNKKWMVPHIRYKDEKGREVDHEAGAKLAMLAGGQYQDLLDLWLDDEAGDFTHPTKGYDIKYVREGKGKMDTRYSMLRCNPTKLDAKYAKQVFNPEEMVRKLILPYAELKEKLASFLTSSPDEDNEPAEKKSSKLKKKKRKSDL